MDINRMRTELSTKLQTQGELYKYKLHNSHGYLQAVRKIYLKAAFLLVCLETQT